MNIQNIRLLLLLLALTAPGSLLAQEDDSAEDTKAGESDEADGETGEAEGNTSEAKAAPEQGSETKSATEAAEVEEAPPTEAAEAASASDESPPSEPSSTEEGESAAASDLDQAPAWAEAPWRPLKHPKFVQAIAVGIFGAQIDSTDAGYSLVTDSSHIEMIGLDIDVLITPKIAVSLIMAESTTRSAAFDVLPAEESYFANSGFGIRTSLRHYELSARYVFSPAFFPVQAYARAGAGFYAGKFTAVSYNTIGNLADRDERGIAPFGTLGAGVEISSPIAVRGRGLPVSVAFVAEGGLRLGGGGQVAAAPSVQLDTLGGVDVGPAYFRAGAKFSVRPRTKAKKID